LKADEQTTEDLFDGKIDRSTLYNVVNKPAAGGVERRAGDWKNLDSVGPVEKYFWISKVVWESGDKSVCMYSEWLGWIRIWLRRDSGCDSIVC
jgi:hypothetical protein